MKKFLRNLFTCSSLFVLMGACNPVFLKGFAKQIPGTIEFRRIFDPTFEKALYKFNISFGKKNLTGLAFFKRMREDNSFRTVLMSETGLKYFDFEFFENDSIIVHYVMDAMNRKGLIRTLTSDFSLIFNTEVDNKVLTFYLPKKMEKGYIIKEKQVGHQYYCFKDSNQPPYKIYRRACLTPATDIEINFNPEFIPSSIIFTHGFINLKMELKLIAE